MYSFNFFKIKLILLWGKGNLRSHVGNETKRQNQHWDIRCHEHLNSAHVCNAQSIFMGKRKIKLCFSTWKSNNTISLSIIHFVCIRYHRFPAYSVEQNEHWIKATMTKDRLLWTDIFLYMKTDASLKLVHISPRPEVVITHLNHWDHTVSSATQPTVQLN